jgi:signal transduction histidine kinase
MKWWFLALFLVVQILLFALMYILNREFSFLVSALMLTPVILFIGYILYSLISEQKEKQDRLLEHIVRETLHEINLPISTIEANMKMLSKDMKSQKELKRVDRVNSALKRLNRLYEVLSYNIKKEIAQVEKEQIDLSIFIKDRVDFFKEFSRNSFKLNLENLKVEVDTIGLEQSVDNIIENAMKYSNRDSEILISIDKTKLIIEDFGVGIEQDELSLIYQRYYQENSASLGEGIGLSIVKSFCDANSIILKIESKKGVGTKVILDFKNLIR